MQRQLCKFCSDPCTFELQNKVCLEMCYSQSGSNIAAPTRSESTGWQTNPNTNITPALQYFPLWHWLMGKWFEERGDKLLLWKSGKSKKKVPSCLTSATGFEYFSHVTEGLENVTWTLMQFLGGFLSAANGKCLWVILNNERPECVLLSLSEIRMVTFF